MRNSKAVVVFWILVLMCSLTVGINYGDKMCYDIAQMSGVETEATDGMNVMYKEFSNTIDLSDVFVIKYDSAAEKVQAETFGNKFIELLNGEYEPTLQASSYGCYSKTDAATSGVMLIAIACNSATFDIGHETKNIRDLASDAKAATGVQLKSYLTGNAAISYDTETSSAEDVSKVDPISIALIFILLGLFFLSFVTAFVPPAVVGVSYGVVLSIVYAIGCMMDVYYISSMLVLITMLGAGCDYGIFIISRYRDERKKGAEHDKALMTAVEWAGESVFTSGLAVIIGFGALSICSFSMIRSMGLILAAGIIIALIAALTLIPALLNLFGEKIFYPSTIQTYRNFSDPNKKGIYKGLIKISKAYFKGVSKFTRKFAIPIVLAAIVICVPTFYMYFTQNDSSDMISIMPKSESVDGLNTIMTQTSGGTIMPTYVIVELKDSAVASQGYFVLGDNYVPYVIWTEAAQSTTVPIFMKISSELSADNMVGTASGLTSWTIVFNQAKAANPGVPTQMLNQAILAQMPDAVRSPINQMMYAVSYGTYNIEPSQIIGVCDAGPVTLANAIDGIINTGTGILSDNGKFVNLMVITNDKPMSDDTMKYLEDLSAKFHNSTDGYDKTYGAIIEKSYISGTSAVMNDVAKDVENQFQTIEVVVIILLVILLFVILRSYITPIRAVITIMSSVIWTVALTRWVFSDMMGTPVIWIVPIVLFVVLLGLGMDYDIFLTTKIKENRSRGMDNHKAIEEALCQSGPIITLCALIMGGTFLTLLFAGSSMLREIGFALGVGILIDGLFMVTFVVPSIMHLLGRWSWRGPGMTGRTE